MQKRNDGSNKRRPILANKIGSIFSNACGTATIARSRALSMAFGFGVAADEEKEHEDGGHESERHVSASFNKTHPCDQGAGANATNSLQVACRRRVVATSLAGILAGAGLRKWKSSLKKVVRVKVRPKIMGNEGKAETKPELELCKKRILMGEKCRALNLSGVLHYDKQGILLPED